MEAVALTESGFWRTPVSPTFHGRDIFAPVAAFLSLGFPPINFGEPTTSVTILPLPHPYQTLDGSLVGHILHTDSFGNLVTNIKSDDLPETKELITTKRIIAPTRQNISIGTGASALPCAFLFWSIKF